MMGGASYYGGFSHTSILPNRSNQHIKRQQEEAARLKKIEHEQDVDGIMQYIYQHFRDACATLEETIECHDAELSEKDKKRLDKAITVMKVGFKIMKFILKRRRKRVIPDNLVGFSAQHPNDLHYLSERRIWDRHFEATRE
jgi:hypothetical protein